MALSFDLIRIDVPSAFFQTVLAEGSFHCHCTQGKKIWKDCKKLLHIIVVQEESENSY